MPNVIHLMQHAARTLPTLVGDHVLQRDFLMHAALNPHLNAAALTLTFDRMLREDHLARATEWNTPDGWRARQLEHDPFAESCAVPLHDPARPWKVHSGAVYPRTAEQPPLHAVVLISHLPWPLVRERTAHTPANALLLHGTPNEMLLALCDHAAEQHTRDGQVQSAVADALYQHWSHQPAPRAPAVMLTPAQFNEALAVIRLAVRLRPRLTPTSSLRA